MKREKVYLIDRGNNGFRIGEPSEIIGIEMCTPDGLDPRLCYHLKWPDLIEDWKPINEEGYQIIPQSELLKIKRTKH